MVSDVKKELSYEGGKKYTRVTQMPEEDMHVASEENKAGKKQLTSTVSRGISFPQTMETICQLWERTVSYYRG